MLRTPSGPLPSIRQKFDSLARRGNCKIDAAPSPQSVVFDGKAKNRRLGSLSRDDE